MRLEGLGYLKHPVTSWGIENTTVRVFQFVFSRAGSTPTKGITPGLQSASELYRPSDRRLSAKLVPTLADTGCRVVSATNPYGR
jgi:hypothetical protein